VVTACATGAHAVGDAARMIKYGDADVMVAGGAEAAICPVGIAGFIACRAMSTGFNDAPERASRPYDKDRDGFVMGEGAGVLVLEEYEHAKARGAKIYAEVAGYGMAGDAYHITAPAEDGDGGFRAMRAALKDAGVDPSEVDYINAHGTSTPLGDEIELGAVTRLLGDAAAKATMSSTKSATGHLLGAAGAIEAAFTCLAIRDQIAPPTINLENPSVESVIDLVPNKPKAMAINVALFNSFGFGGTNASVVFKKVTCSGKSKPRSKSRRVTPARSSPVAIVSGGAVFGLVLFLVIVGALWSYGGPGPAARDGEETVVDLRQARQPSGNRLHAQACGGDRLLLGLRDGGSGYRRCPRPEGWGIRGQKPGLDQGCPVGYSRRKYIAPPDHGSRGADL